MDTPDQIYLRAAQRAQAQGLPYAGALLPTEAHQLLQQQNSAKLVDVRTKAEWEWVGRTPQAVLVEWNTWPSGQANPAFLEQLSTQVPGLDTPVLFMCRSGGRSNSAAAAAARAGYTRAYNVLQGFEGDKNEKGQRNSVGGWRAAGLPWSQG